MQKHIYIADPEILLIPIKECGEPLIDIKNYNDLRFGDVPENEFTKDCYTKIRESVFKKLCAAQKMLPNKWCFRLYEGFRSLKVQQMLFEQEYKRVTSRFPNADQQKLFYETTRLISPVFNLDGSKNIPAHNTGGAVDVEIVDQNGDLVDMGMAAKDWYDVDPDLCLSDSHLINKRVAQNRKILREAMEANDFVNYSTEWWHFSYGDRYWAFHQSLKQAIYGSADDLYSKE